MMQDPLALPLALLFALMAAAVGGFVFAASFVIKTADWLSNKSRFPALQLVPMGIFCWLTSAGRVAVLLGLIAGTLYLLAEKVGIAKYAPKLVGWLSLAFGGLVATGGTLMFANNPLWLVVFLGWGSTSAAAGAILLLDERRELKNAQIQQIDVQKNVEEVASGADA
ncbi:hypothetical protein [Gloeobacter morelensis]|uniref:hypothetical protein n=1 Tax=Gloeobacter morelensis TaxID=2907343 RepID=UPI001E5EFFD8|nr:hypothetical protein [Gloeobacter morelensis]UFP97239.1 hypothetical protein ISF26_24260 [Gloeobacter morelensis MG652769]